ncbi:putative protein OS=Streptomyces fumanus OX=67302 GN=GCM10018772_69910 PE=4 SV=1 [Streptomyces fumanus]|uniref:Uncharacterized protein n=1 Tax=Streptomyces fumanus TaxID=67302 RepID=A0A919EC67_9ACTN|nr:hypothetical protein GCM10018772_69910 [Streptomyces fumanus]
MPRPRTRNVRSPHTVKPDSRPRGETGNPCTGPHDPSIPFNGPVAGAVHRSRDPRWQILRGTPRALSARSRDRIA